MSTETESRPFSRQIYSLQMSLNLPLNYLSIYLSISTASPPLGDYVQVRVSAVLGEKCI